jgi:hypothetical protein
MADDWLTVLWMSLLLLSSQSLLSGNSDFDFIFAECPNVDGNEDNVSAKGAFRPPVPAPVPVTLLDQEVAFLWTQSDIVAWLHWMGLHLQPKCDVVVSSSRIVECRYSM